jgi:hypothetical protein
MGATDQRGARYRVVFLLIALNRDDEAFAFSQYWLQMDERCDTDPESVYGTHDYSHEGDWVYPRETDCRYSNPLPYCSNLNSNVILLPFIVAFLIIKLKIVAIHDAAVRSVELVLKGKAGQRIRRVEPLIEEMLIRQVIDIESQREQIRQLLDAIDHLNPSVLPALINPSPLTKQPPPPRSAPGHPTEAWRILIDCFICFHYIPGAVEMLKERYGSLPVYDWDMSSLTRNDVG